MNRLKGFIAGLLLAGLGGCATTESLYAQYDELCPVEARVTNTGMVMVTGIAPRVMDWQRRAPPRVRCGNRQCISGSIWMT